jgi:hypothetical protein
VLKTYDGIQAMITGGMWWPLGSMACVHWGQLPQHTQPLSSRAMTTPTYLGQ